MYLGGRVPGVYCAQCVMWVVLCFKIVLHKDRSIFVQNSFKYIMFGLLR